jgi:uncharacterized protein
MTIQHHLDVDAPRFNAGLAPLEPFLDFFDILDHVQATAPSRRFPLHGEVHWRATAATGLMLADLDPRVDRATVLVYALLHDSQRQAGGVDADHGPRAARFADSLNQQRPFMGPERIEQLVFACRWHSNGLSVGNPTVGACWDADRLNLCRHNIAPDPKYLSLEVTREKLAVLSADVRRTHADPPVWEELLFMSRLYES